jgi:hypothetical protein
MSTNFQNLLIYYQFHTKHAITNKPEVLTHYHAWFSPDVLVSSTIKADRHDMTATLLT